MMPKVIDVEIRETWSFDKKLIVDIKILTALQSHELETLKRLFYDTLNINVPKDIMQEHDEGYIKSNISHILLHFIKKIWANERIILEDKLFKCSKCNQWASFVTYTDTKPRRKAGICLICLEPKKIGKLKYEGVWK